MEGISKELARLEEALFKANGWETSEIIMEGEAFEYFGFAFKIGQKNITYRKAKVTPKKNGLFVTLWKRDKTGKTVPFNADDDVDFYIIAAEQENRFGYFVFSKHILATWNILTVGGKEGKRGFRIYPDWTRPESRQAQKTQGWQTACFVDLTQGADGDVNRVNVLLKKTLQ